MAGMSIEFDLQFLKKNPGLVGVDEVGRGPLAGPVVAGAVFVFNGFYEYVFGCDSVGLIKDSKQMSEEKRQRANQLIKVWEQEGFLITSLGYSSVAEIETLNILGATRLAMRRSLESLEKKILNISKSIVLKKDDVGELFELENGKRTVPILIDGKPLKPFTYKHESIVKGDSKSFAIGMAAIIAKVERDGLMKQLDKKFPGYAFASNSGYGTLYHRDALKKFGPTEVHRPSFLKKILGLEDSTEKTTLLFLEK